MILPLYFLLPLLRKRFAGDSNIYICVSNRLMMRVNKIGETFLKIKRSYLMLRRD